MKFPNLWKSGPSDAEKAIEKDFWGPEHKVGFRDLITARETIILVKIAAELSILHTLRATNETEGAMQLVNNISDVSVKVTPDLSSMRHTVSVQFWFGIAPALVITKSFTLVESQIFDVETLLRGAITFTTEEIMQVMAHLS